LTAKSSSATPKSPAPNSRLTANISPSSSPIWGQEIPIKVTTEIRQADSAWLATGAMEPPMGPVSNEGRLDAATLITLGRRVKQGPVEIGIEFGGNKAAG
jgi:hypothetical protein